MPSFCAILNCSNRHGRDDKSFYRLPKIIEHQGEKTKELSKQRRDKYLQGRYKAEYLGQH